MEGRLILCLEVCVAEDVQNINWGYSYKRYATHFGTYSLSFLEIAIVWEVGQGNGYIYRQRDILYYPIIKGVYEVCAERILRWTLTFACYQIWMCTNQQSFLCHNGFNICSIIIRSMWLVQQCWRILNAYKWCWNENQVKRSRITVTSRPKDLFSFPAWIATDLGAKSSESQWWPLWPCRDWQCILYPGYDRLVASAGATRLKVRWFLQCGMWYIV